MTAGTAPTARWAARALIAACLAVAASALAAVLIYRYIDVGALGPLPDMYEPAWYTTKITTTIAEAVALPAAIAGLLTARQGQAPGASASRTSRDPDRSIR